MAGGGWPFAVRTLWKPQRKRDMVCGVDTRVISIFETAATFQTGRAFYAFPLTSLTTRSARATAALAVDADEG